MAWSNWGKIVWKNDIKIENRDEEYFNLSDGNKIFVHHKACVVGYNEQGLFCRYDVNYYTKRRDEYVIDGHYITVKPLGSNGLEVYFTDGKDRYYILDGMYIDERSGIFSQTDKELVNAIKRKWKEVPTWK